MLYIKVKKTKNMGWGVFAARDFKPGEVIEICPSVPLTKTEVKTVSTTRLENWFFEWHNFNESALIMGYGMIYNHSDSPNAVHIFDFNRETVTIKSVSPIKKGSQIFINYNQYQPGVSQVEMFDPKTKKYAVYTNGKLVSPQQTRKK